MPAASKTFSYRWTTWVAILLVLTYLVYLYQQYDALHNLNQHELALQGRELESIVNNAVGTVRKADEDICGFDTDQPQIELISAQKCKEVGGLKAEDVRIEVGNGLFIKTGPKTAEARAKGAKPSPEFQVQLDRILDQLAFPEAFQLVFVTTAEGQVIHQESQASSRWRHNLSWQEEKLREPTPGEDEDIVIANLKDLLGSDAKPSFAQLSSAGSHFSLTLGGARQEIYLQPVNFGGQKAVIGGVAPTGELLRRALQVDTYLIALLVFAFFAGVLGKPFVKFFALDPRERFRLKDLRGLYLSSGALLLLGLFAVLAIDGYCRFRQKADAGLEQLATSLASSLGEEIREGVAQLAKYDETAAATPQLLGCAELPTVHNWFDLKAPKLEAPSRNIFTEQVAWVGSNGKQLFKVTADAQGSNQPVGHRLYFKSVRQRSLYRIEGLPNDFFMAPSLSITDGKFYTFFSMPSRIKQSGCTAADGSRSDGEPLTAVLTTRLMSARQALPNGYGFAVMNREGAVLFHSDSRLALRQNLFAELGGSSALKSLVLAREPGTIATSYREKPHRFYVLPFKALQSAGAPPHTGGRFFIVSFRDVSAEIATAAQVFETSLFVILALLGGWRLALFLLDYVSARSPGVNRYGTWMWPQQSMAGFYRWFAIGGLIIVALASLTFVLFREVGQLVFLFAPLATIPLGLAGHAWTQQTGGRRERLHDPRWYYAMWALLVVWVIFAPAVVLFRMTLGHEFGTLVETENNWLEQRKFDIGQVIEQEVRAEGYPESVQLRVKEIAKRYQSPAPEPFRTGSEPIQQPLKQAVVGLLERVGDSLPIHTETAIRLRAQQSKDAYFTSPLLLNWWAALLVGALFLAGHWWTRWSARRVFLIDCENPPAGESSQNDAEYWRMQWERLPIDERNLLIQISEENLANPRQTETVKKLLGEGYLKLNPDLRLATGEFARFLKSKTTNETQRTQLETWEQGDSEHGWKHARRILIAGLAILFLFVIATQPGFQSGLTASFGGATTAVLAISKLRDAMTALWPSQSKSTPAA